jgi:hypothetical protein
MSNSALSLGDWLASRTTQRDTRRRIDNCGADWSRGPVHARFDAAIAALPVQTADAVADTMVELFSHETWLDALI